MRRRLDDDVEDEERADVRAAERDLLWFYRDAAAALGFRAQAYGVAGGGVYDDAASDRDHFARLEPRHRRAVERERRVSIRLDELARRDVRTFELVYRDEHAIRSASETLWQRLRHAFPRRVVHLGDDVVDAKGRPRFVTKDGTRVRQMAWTDHTTVSLLPLALDTRELRLAFARHNGGRIGAPAFQLLPFLAALVDGAASHREMSDFVARVRADAAERLDSALSRYAR